MKERAIVEEQVKKWIDDGIVIPYTSDYASPVVVVKKKNGSPRVCIDYRSINKKMIKDRYPVLLIEDKLDDLQKTKVFSTLDLKNGFFHVKVNEDSQKYLSFVTHSGQYTFLRAPFGCSNSPRVFQRYINDVFRELISKDIVRLYMDDIVVLSENYDGAIEHLKLVLNYACKAGLEINWSKCQLLQTKIEYLVHVIEIGTVKPSVDRSRAVQNFRVPKNIKKV